MHKSFPALSCSILMLLAACGQTPTTGSSDTLVITQGAPTPIVQKKAEGVLRVLSDLEYSSTSVNGSTTSEVSTDGCQGGAASNVRVFFAVSGTQHYDGSFKVYQNYSYNGAQFLGTNPTTVNVPKKSNGNTIFYHVDVSITNGTSSDISGNKTLVVTPYEITNTNVDTSVKNPKKLEFGKNPSGTITVKFACSSTPIGSPPAPPVNTPPSITVPKDFTVEAEGPVTSVPFTVTAEDNQDGDISSSVECDTVNPAQLGLGTHTVNCLVTDSGNLSAGGSFKITVQDTTAPELSNVPMSSTIIATNKNGYLVDVTGVTAEDLVDPNPTVTCLPTDLLIPVGGNRTFTCTATDASENTSAPQSFTVNVTLGNINQTLLQPIKADGTSALKRGSTVPVKLMAPNYVTSAATDLSDGLRLTVSKLSAADTVTDKIEENLATGSTVWRYDEASGQYVFNLSTKNSFFSSAKYKAEVSFQGVTLASGAFNLK